MPIFPADGCTTENERWDFLRIERRLDGDIRFEPLSFNATDYAPIADGKPALISCFTEGGLYPHVWGAFYQLLSALEKEEPNLHKAHANPFTTLGDRSILVRGSILHASRSDAFPLLAKATTHFMDEARKDAPAALVAWGLFSDDFVPKQAAIKELESLCTPRARAKPYRLKTYTA
jgi:hypothetical protein